MLNRLEVSIYTVVGSVIIFSATKTILTLENKISQMETKLECLREKVSDLELFKLKVYSNDITIGRRVWDDDLEEDEDSEID